nr:uncharacterized protein LOC123753050 [Procambarus clarkii]
MQPSFSGTESAAGLSMPPSFCGTESGAGLSMPPSFSGTESAAGLSMQPSFCGTESAPELSMQPSFSGTESAAGLSMPPSFCGTESGAGHAHSYTQETGLTYDNISSGFTNHQLEWVPTTFGTNGTPAGPGQLPVSSYFQPAGVELHGRTPGGPAFHFGSLPGPSIFGKTTKWHQKPPQEDPLREEKRRRSVYARERRETMKARKRGLEMALTAQEDHVSLLKEEKEATSERVRQLLAYRDELEAKCCELEDICCEDNQ